MPKTHFGVEELVRLDSFGQVASKGRTSRSPRRPSSRAGERRVDRALARDPGASFWRLAERGYLPRISREYVSRFFAVVRVAGEREPTAVSSAL